MVVMVMYIIMGMRLVMKMKSSYGKGCFLCGRCDVDITGLSTWMVC